MEYYVENMLKYIDYADGFFIEAGAYDGITQSYSYELEKRGWFGVLIEPSKVAYKKCLKNRSTYNYFYNFALAASKDIRNIVGDFDGNLMSSVDGKRLHRDEKIKVRATTLNSIVKKIGITIIDLFILDVEGYEAEVLKGFDLKKYKPKYIIIEMNLAVEDEVRELLKDYKQLTNLTNCNSEEFPDWDGTHNDFLFIKE